MALTLAFAPDGKTFLSGGGIQESTGEVRFWEVSKATAWEVAHADAIRCAAFSTDASTLATGSADRTVRLWDTASGADRGVLKGQGSAIVALAFAPGGKSLAVAGEDKTVKLWDTVAATVKATLPLQTQPIDLLAYSPDGKTLAICGDGTKDKRAEVRLWDAATRSVRLRIDVRLGRVGAMTFSPEGKTLLTGDRGSSLVQSWDTATGGEVFRKEASPSSQVVMQARNQGGLFSVVRQATVRGSAGIRSLTYSRDGKQIALGLADGTLRVWESTVWQERGNARQQKPIAGAAFAMDEKSLATAGKDGTMTVWELPR